MSKQLEIECPCCSTRILVDVRTERIMRTLRPEQLDDAGKPVVQEADWDDALGRVQERELQGLDKLTDALEREKNKTNHLDELFQRAQEKLEEDDDTDVDDEFDDD